MMRIALCLLPSCQPVSAVPLESVSNRPAWKGGGVLAVAAGGVHPHSPCSRGLEHHHMGGPGRERERRIVWNGEDQGSHRKRAGRGEIRTVLGRSAVRANLADLKVYRVVLQILRDDCDAANGIAIRVVSGGEGLSVISAIGDTLIPALTTIADQTGPRHHQPRRVVIVHRHRYNQRQPLIVGVCRRGRVCQRHHIIRRVRCHERRSPSPAAACSSCRW